MTPPPEAAFLVRCKQFGSLLILPGSIGHFPASIKMPDDRITLKLHDQKNKVTPIPIAWPKNRLRPALGDFAQEPPSLLS
jgi:hypothetical protein